MAIHHLMKAMLGKAKNCATVITVKIVFGTVCEQLDGGRTAIEKQIVARVGDI